MVEKFLEQTTFTSQAVSYTHLVRWVQYWDSYLDILILNRLLIRLNVMVVDFVLVIASLPALIPKHMRLIIPVV